MDERADESPASAVLYRRLLGLATDLDREPLLEDLVRLLVELTRAQLALVELDDGQHPTLQFVHGCSNGDFEALRSSISRDLLAHAPIEGQMTFADNVEQRASELCRPIGTRGFLYVQGNPGAGFTDHDRALVELAARHIAPIVSPLLQRRHLLDAFARHNGNASAVARDLGIARSHLYTLILSFKLRRRT